MAISGTHVFEVWNPELGGLPSYEEKNLRSIFLYQEHMPGISSKELKAM